VGATTTTSTPNNVNEIVSQSGGANRTLTYDANGSLTNDGASRTFEWDGANRLAAINYAGTNNRTEFTYDGLSRMVKIVEKTRARTTSTRKFVWCGMEKCEFRDANDAVTLFAYPQGQFSGSSAYFYTRDHLGSIREMRSTGKKGAVVARFDYDPYGRSTAVISNTLPDFNFTGLYRHATSNLDLAVYRAYDPDLGRWLSRDPLKSAEISQGTDLYTYVSNDPLDGVDPLGLLKIYGNWCGPDWTGGRRESFVRHRVGFYAPPIDGLDAACAKHDICYYKCRKAHPCDSDCRSRCFRSCDDQLTSAAYAVSSFSGDVIGFFIDRPGKRDPEPNDPSCACDQKK
jgi:RHS repeat-associated protein